MNICWLHYMNSLKVWSASFKRVTQKENNCQFVSFHISAFLTFMLIFQRYRMDLESQIDKTERLEKELNDLLATEKDNNEVR